MMTSKNEIKCLFLVAFCFHHVLAQDILCAELQGHRNWPELRRTSSVCGLTKSREDSIVPRIMGGRPAALAEFPWMALLTFSPCNVTCGGFLITGRHVLTAGHCCAVNGIVKGCNVTKVILGAHDLTASVECDGDRCAPEPIGVRVKKVTIHEGFNWNNPDILNHDICLLTLEKSVQPSTYVNPICLADECNWKEPDYKRGKLKIAGWGIDEDQRVHAVLQTLDVMAVPHSTCGPSWEAYSELLKINESRQLCAGIGLGRDACKGDSGGPLMYQSLDRMVAVGIVSFGQNCSRNDTSRRPEVFTRIAHYIPWILDNMWH